MFISHSLVPKDRILVVNPMYNYWSVQLTSEVALQESSSKNIIKWFDVSPINKRMFQINSHDFVNHIIRKNNLEDLLEILSYNNIETERKSMKILEKNNKYRIYSINQLIQTEYKNHPIGSIVYSGICSKLRSTNFTFKNYKKLIFKYIDYCKLVIDKLDDEVEKFKPTSIFTVNDRIMGSAIAVSVGRQKHIKTNVVYWGSDNSLIQYHSNSLYNIDEWQECVQHKFINDPPSENDKISIMSKIEYLGVEADKSSIHFTKYQKKGKGVDLPKNKKLCVFYATSTYEHSPLLFIKLKNGFKSQFEAFSALQEVCHRRNYILVLKHHPIKKRLFYRNRGVVHDWEKFDVKKETIELNPKTDIDTYTLINQADVNVTWGSNVGLESLAIGKPTLILGNLAWLNKGWGVHAWSVREIEEFFCKAAPKVKKSELIPWYWYLQHFGFPAKFTRLENKSILIGGKAIFQPRFIFYYIYKFFMLKRIVSKLL